MKRDSDYFFGHELFRSARYGHRGSVRYRLWQAIRARRRFAITDLYELGIGAPRTAQNFCALLCKSGLMVRSGKGQYRLLRDTGPVPPSGLRADENATRPRPNSKDPIGPPSHALAILDTLMRLPCWTCSIERDPARQCSGCSYGGEDRERFIAATDRASECVRARHSLHGKREGVRHA